MFRRVIILTCILLGIGLVSCGGSGGGGGALGPPPTWRLLASASLTSIAPGTSVSFTCEARGGTAPYSYLWEFDDPHTYTAAVTAREPAHTFNWAGRHEVKVTATDALGVKTWVVLEVNVHIEAAIVERDAVSDVGLDDTGVTNCTATLQAYLVANYNNATGLRINFPSGTYRFEPQVGNGGHIVAIDIPDNVGDFHKLEFVGTGATRPILIFYNNSAVIDKTHCFFHLSGANLGPPEETYVRIANLDVSMENDPDTYAVVQEFIQGGDIGARDEFVTIEDCSIRNFGRVVNGSNTIVRRCNLVGCGHPDIEMFRFATDGIAKQCYIGSPGNLHSHLFYFTASQNTHVIDTFGDGANANPGRLFVQWKMECHDAVLRGCLFTNTDGYGMMLGGYDGQAYRVEVSDTRFQGCAFGMWLFSSSGDIQITENFFSGFTDGNASALAAGHDHLPSDGGLSVVGVTFARNTLGLNAPRGTGSPVLNVYDNYGLGAQYTWDVTESGTINDDSLYLLTDPPGWRNAGGYVDPGEFDATAPVVNNFAINGGAASSTTRSVTLNIAATDPGAGMGAAERFPFLLGGAMQFSDDGSSWSEVIPYNSTHDWTLSSGTGVKTVYVRFRDVDGNWSSVTTDTISFTGP